MHDTASSSKPHLFTVADYMALAIDARTELPGGVIYDVSPKDEAHSNNSDFAAAPHYRETCGAG